MIINSAKYSEHNGIRCLGEIKWQELKVWTSYCQAENLDPGLGGHFVSISDS